MDLSKHLTTYQVASDANICVASVCYRFKSLGITPVKVSEKYYFTPIQADAIINFQPKPSGKPHVTDALIKDYFKSNGENTIREISIRLKLPYIRVSNVLNHHFRNAMEEMTAKYEIYPSRMNDEDFD